MPAYQICPLTSADQPWVARFLEERWGTPRIVSRGKVYDVDRYPGFIALQDGLRAGLLTYRLEAGQCEILSIDSLVEGIGIGSALIAAAREVAIQAGCQRMWLITTNDNLHALRFYQKRGFRLAALYPNALEVSRQLKPQIPLVGLDGIPLRDEIELEMALT